MGANMARRLKDQGYAITAVYDSHRESAGKLSGGTWDRGRRPRFPRSPPRRISSSPLSPMTEAMDDSVRGGRQRLRFAARQRQTASPRAMAEQGRLFINCATVSPDTHVMVESRAEAAGAQSLEACMASSITQAREGTLYLMCGGKAEAYERAKPILEKLSSSLRYIGGSGQAAKVKALVNMVNEYPTPLGPHRGRPSGSAMRSGWT